MQEDKTKNYYLTYRDYYTGITYDSDWYSFEYYYD
jgi:hypothetical protein